MAGGFADKGISGAPQRLEGSGMILMHKWLLLLSVKTVKCAEQVCKPDRHSPEGDEMGISLKVVAVCIMVVFQKLLIACGMIDCLVY